MTQFLNNSLPFTPTWSPFSSRTSILPAWFWCCFGRRPSEMVGAESEAGQRRRATINDVFRSPRGKNPDNSGPQGAKNNPCDRVGQRNSAATTLFRRATPSAGNKQRPSSQRWLSSGAASQTMAHCSANVGRPLYYHSVDSDDKGKQQYLFIYQISSYCCLSSADIYSLVLTPGGGRTPIHIKGTHSDTLGSGS